MRVTNAMIADEIRKRMGMPWGWEFSCKGASGGMVIVTASRRGEVVRVKARKKRISLAFGLATAEIATEFFYAFSATLVERN